MEGEETAVRVQYMKEDFKKERMLMSSEPKSEMCRGRVYFSKLRACVESMQLQLLTKI